MKMCVTQMIETVRIEVRAKTHNSDVKAFEFKGPGLKCEELLSSFGNGGSTYQTHALFKED